MVKLGLLLLLLAAVSHGQSPLPCQSPGQWESRVIVLDSRSGRHDVSYYAYDAVNRRTARFESLSNSTVQEQHLYVIELFALNVTYTMDLDTGVCTASEPLYPWFPHNVLSNATFGGTFFVGSPTLAGGGVQVDAWSLPLEHYNWYGLFTRVACVPVRQTLYSRSSEQQQQRTEQFFDVTVGIRDPNIFTPPAPCLAL